MSGINTRDGQSNSEKPVNLSIGDWVVVEYMHDKNRYPGQIVAFADEEPKISVQVMHRSGKFWKWTDGKPEEVFYYEDNIIKKIGLPIQTGPRGSTFTFEESIV